MKKSSQIRAKKGVSYRKSTGKYDATVSRALPSREIRFSTKKIPETPFENRLSTPPSQRDISAAKINLLVPKLEKPRNCVCCGLRFLAFSRPNSGRNEQIRPEMTTLLCLRTRRSPFSSASDLIALF